VTRLKHMERVEIRLYADCDDNRKFDVKLGWFVKERPGGMLVCQIDGKNARPLVNVGPHQVRPVDAVTRLGKIAP